MIMMTITMMMTMMMMIIWLQSSSVWNDPVFLFVQLGKNEKESVKELAKMLYLSFDYLLYFVFWAVRYRIMGRMLLRKSVSVVFRYVVRLQVVCLVASWKLHAAFPIDWSCDILDIA